MKKGKKVSVLNQGITHLRRVELHLDMDENNVRQVESDGRAGMRSPRKPDQVQQCAQTPRRKCSVYTGKGGKPGQDEITIQILLLLSSTYRCCEQRLTSRYAHIATFEHQKYEQQQHTPAKSSSFASCRSPHPKSAPLTCLYSQNFCLFNKSPLWEFARCYFFAPSLTSDTPQCTRNNQGQQETQSPSFFFRSE